MRWYCVFWFDVALYSASSLNSWGTTGCAKNCRRTGLAEALHFKQLLRVFISFRGKDFKRYKNEADWSREYPVVNAWSAETGRPVGVVRQRVIGSMKSTTRAADCDASERKSEGRSYVSIVQCTHAVYSSNFQYLLITLWHKQWHVAEPTGQSIHC